MVQSLEYEANVRSMPRAYRLLTTATRRLQNGDCCKDGIVLEAIPNCN